MSHPRAALGILASCLALGGVMAAPAGAKPQEVRVRSQNSLHFGTFMVFGTGSRRVSATGAVADTAIVSLEGSQPRPARFTIEYDRGNESKQALDITIELVLSVSGSLRFGGVDARLGAFETDLPGHPRVAAGDIIVVRLNDCRSRICQQTFSVGGQLDVARSFGGARIDIPITIDARIAERDRSR